MPKCLSCIQAGSCWGYDFHRDFHRLGHASDAYPANGSSGIHFLALPPLRLLLLIWLILVWFTYTNFPLAYRDYLFEWRDTFEV